MDLREHTDDQERRKFLQMNTLDQKGVSRRLDLALHHVGSTGRPATLQYGIGTDDKAWYIVHPYSVFHGVWDIIMVVVLLVTFIRMRSRQNV